jgi:hypothetical protein
MSNTGSALVCKLQNITPIPGADKIVQANLFGETIITSKDTPEGTLGLLFDCETQLSHEYCHFNNLYRHSDLNADKSEVGYFEDIRRVKPIKLRGVKCSAMWVPLDSLAFIDNKYGELMEGMQLKAYGGVEICDKYVNQATLNARKNNKQGRARQNNVPLFREHFDTDSYERNKHKIVGNSILIATEKLHGTSCRVANLPVVEPRKWWQRLFNLFPKSNYQFVVGSRRVLKSVGEKVSTSVGQYYNDNIHVLSSELFRGKLHKGETIYYEIVGFEPSGKPIMPSHSNEKLSKFLHSEEYDAFVERYGKITQFTYGCSDPIIDTVSSNYFDVYVYRITLTNEEGHVIDYSWEQVKQRCDEMGVKHVPELFKIMLPAETSDFYQHVSYSIEQAIAAATNAPSTEFPQHIREGICVRVETGRLTPVILKNKSYLFKVLENIIKDTAVVDLEEAN